MTHENCEIIDITFKGGRKQSEILKELGTPTKVNKEVLVPTSLTPEQLKLYCLNVIKSTDNQGKRRVFSHFFNIIDENESLKREIRKYKLRELREHQIEETPDDIQ